MQRRELSYFLRSRSSKHARYTKEQSKTTDGALTQSRPGKKAVKECKSLPQKPRSSVVQVGSDSQTAASRAERQEDGTLAQPRIDNPSASEFRIRGFPGPTTPQPVAAATESSLNKDPVGKDHQKTADGEADQTNTTSNEVKENLQEEHSINTNEQEVKGAEQVSGDQTSNSCNIPRKEKDRKDKEACMTLKSILKTLSRSDLFLSDVNSSGLDVSSRRVKKYPTVDRYVSETFLSRNNS